MMLEELGLDRARAAEILAAPADRILEAQTAVAATLTREGGPIFGPVRDGVTLLDQPLSAVRAGAAAQIPVMAGTNRDEVKLFAATVRREEMDDDALLRAVGATLGKPGPEKAREVIGVYRRSRASGSGRHGWRWRSSPTSRTPTSTCSPTPRRPGGAHWARATRWRCRSCSAR